MLDCISAFPVPACRSALAGKSSTLSSLAADEAASSARVQELRAARPGGDSAAALQQRMEAAAREAAGAAAALVSRETAHQQSHSRLEGLQQDSVRLAAAIEKNQAKQRQVEEQIAALMQQAAAQQREVAQADAAAIERLQRLCRAEAAVQEARAALSAMETQLAHRASADSSAAGGGPGPRGSQSVDEAVAVLAEGRPRDGCRARCTAGCIASHSWRTLPQGQPSMRCCANWSTW